MRCPWEALGVDRWRKQGRKSTPFSIHGPFVAFFAEQREGTSPGAGVLPPEAASLWEQVHGVKERTHF